MPSPVVALACRVPSWGVLLALALVGCSSQEPSDLSDAGTPDAGALVDAGADAHVDEADSGAGMDAFVPPVRDGGSSADAHEMSDGGIGSDAYVPCGIECPPEDAGTGSTDASVTGDAGAARDAGSDSGPPADTTPVVQLALGDTHSCLMRSSGRVFCWGNPSFTGWPVAVLLDATDIAAEGTYGYATRRDGSVWRWEGTGANLTDTQWPGGPPLSMPAEPATPTPMYAPGESFPLPTGDYVEIYGTDRDACGRRMDGSIWCWGSNNYGQLARETGELTETGYAFPAGEALMGGARMQATVLGVGAAHRCAALRDRRVVCWGSDSLLQLGRWVEGLESVEPIEPLYYTTY